MPRKRLVVALMIASGACSLRSLDGFTGASTDSVEGGAPDAPTVVDAGRSFRSCNEAHVSEPTLPDGLYRLDPDGPEGAQPDFEAFCDMTSDDGGWMLVTPAMIVSDRREQMTATIRTDARGGLVYRGYANAPGCAGSPVPQNETLFVDRTAWTRIRYHEEFHGGAACWAIFGGHDDHTIVDPNVRAFDPLVDVIRDEQGMGGPDADTFPRNPVFTDRCDAVPPNFWIYENRSITRSATVILARGSPGRPAGLATVAGCNVDGEGESSPTYWQYTDVFVR